MIVKLLREHHLEFLSLKGGCRGSSESTHVKMPHCLKSHALAHYFSVAEKACQFICRIGHYLIPFNFLFFCFIVDFKEHDGEVFDSFCIIIFS